MAFKVRQSSIKTWMQCKRKYHYKQVEGLRKKRISRPLKFGTLVHESVETIIEGESFGSYLANIDPVEVDSDEEDIRQTLSDIMHEYQLKWKGDGLRYLKAKSGKKSEHKFHMHLCKGIELSGTIDGGARTEDGRRWLVEHKTFSKEWDESQRWRNLQSTLYYPAFEELFGRSAAGVMWDYIYSKPPSIPKLTKKGKVSEAAIVTLPVTVNRFIAENKLKSSQCASLIRAGEAGVDRYFKRIHTPRNARVERVMTNEAISIAREMQKGHGTQKTRSIDRHCSWCEYEPLCRARLLGQDYKFVKRTQYYVDHDELEDIERESE